MLTKSDLEILRGLIAAKVDSYKYDFRRPEVIELMRLRAKLEKL